MKFVVITRDEEIADAASRGFDASDEVLVFDDWEPALEATDGADMLFVDMLATLEAPHKISGYERFAEAKMSHANANSVPLVLIGVPADYELDFMTGWPNFVFAHIRRPITDKIFRRASTWI